MTAQAIPVPAFLALLACLAAGARAGETPPKTTAERAEPAEAAEPQTLAAERPQQPLALQEAIRLALDHNLNLAAEKLSPQRAATVVIEERAVFDPTTALDFQRTKINEQTRGSAFDSPEQFTQRLTPATEEGAAAAAPRPGDIELPYFRTQNWTGSLSLTKTFTPGTSVELFKEWARDWDERPFTGISPAYSEEFGARLTQPLLRGFGIRVNTAAIAIAENDRRIARAALHDVALETVAQTMKTYWELVFALRNRELLLKSLQRARNLQQDIQARVEARVLGARDPSVAQAAAEVAVREENIVLAEDQIRDVEDALKVLTDLAHDPGYWRTALVPTTEPPTAAPPLDPDQAAETALANRPDYLQQTIAIENTGITLRVSRNQLLPELNLTARAASTGLGPEWHRSRHHSGTLDHYDLSFGLTFEYPLGNRAARARTRRARLSRQQAILRRKALERQIHREVRQAVRQAHTHRERLRAARLSVQAEEERLRAETIRFQEARVGTIQDVLDAQAALADAQLREARALIDLNQSLVDLERRKGTLLEAHRITLEDEADRD